MPHSLEAKKKVVTRLRRIKGQAEALERAVEQGTDCGALLQQLSALRGATTGLMAEVLESHLRETMARPAEAAQSAATDNDEIAAIMRVIRPYLK